MRIFVCVFMLGVLLPVSALARDDCPEMSATQSAIEARQNKVTTVYDTMIDDPEDDRGALGSCLQSINSLGDAYSMGVRLPGLDQIIEALCDALRSELKSKFAELKSSVNSAGFGSSEPFSVNGDPSAISAELLRRLRTGKL